MTGRQLLDYVTMAVIWGFSFLLVLRVVEAFGWVAAVSLRALIASAILLVAALATGRRLAFGSWRPLAVVGATTVAGQLLGLSFATPRIGTAMAAIFVGTIPLFSMVIGRLWGGERMTRTALVGLVLGFGGIVLLVGFPAVPVTATFVLGCASSIFGAVCAAFGSNYAHRRLRAVGSWEQTIGAFAAGGLMTLPLILLVPIARVPTAVDALTLILLAGTCSSLAYVLYFRLVSEVGATLAISVEFVVTVLAVFIGAALLREPLTIAQLAGGGVIILGCSLVLGLLPVRRRVPGRGEVAVAAVAAPAVAAPAPGLVGAADPSPTATPD